MRLGACGRVAWRGLAWPVAWRAHAALGKRERQARVHRPMWAAEGHRARGGTRHRGAEEGAAHRAQANPRRSTRAHAAACKRGWP